VTVVSLPTLPAPPPPLCVVKPVDFVPPNFVSWPAAQPDAPDLPAKRPRCCISRPGDVDDAPCFVAPALAPRARVARTIIGKRGIAHLLFWRHSRQLRRDRSRDPRRLRCRDGTQPRSARAFRASRCG